MDTLAEVQSSLLGPIVSQWMARIEAAKTSKQRFDMIAKLCRQFFGSSAKAMWEEDFRKEFYPTLEAPTFQINLNKAFELVAVIGPSLFWKNPERKVQSYQLPDQTQIAQLLGVQEEEVLQAAQQAQAMEQAIKNIRNSLAGLVLDYTQREQPGTLKSEVEQCITEFLLTGLGLIWTESYEHPGTGEILTKNVYGSVDDLQIDPDCKRSDWSDSRWISVCHYDPVWVVERKFGYPPGYLMGRGTRISAEYRSAIGDQDSNNKYCDMIEWHEVWSTGGIGARIGGVDAQRSQFLDAAVGDNCYLCLTKNVPHPLNLPPAMLANGSVEEVKEAVKWRTQGFGAIHEVWMDGRWPCTPLKSYPVPGSPWPLAPLAPGLGYLISMNIIMVSKLNQAWDQRREIIGVAAEVRDTVMAAIKSDDSPAIIPINAAIGKPINELIQKLERGTSQDDLLMWMEYLGNEFAKATGLMDIHYGLTRTQARVSSDIDSKNQAASIRPEKMREDIVDWVIKFSTSELWLAAQYIEGKQLVTLLGQWGAIAWDNLVKALPLEELIREMSCFIDAKDISRPDHARDLDGLNYLANPFMQIAVPYAQQTGDPGPLNAFLALWMEAMDLRNTDSLMFGSFLPQPDPAMQQMQQQMAALEAGKLEAQTGEIQAKTIGRLTDTQFKMRGVTPQMMTKIQQDQIKFQMDMQQDSDRHLQELLQNEELFQQTLAQLKKQNAAKPRPGGTK